jgi:hypothetical protein
MKKWNRRRKPWQKKLKRKLNRRQSRTICQSQKLLPGNTLGKCIKSRHRRRQPRYSSKTPNSSTSMRRLTLMVPKRNRIRRRSNLATSRPTWLPSGRILVTLSRDYGRKSTRRWHQSYKIKSTISLIACKKSKMHPSLVKVQVSRKRQLNNSKNNRKMK